MLTLEGLVRIVTNAAGKGSHVVIRNLDGFTLDDLVRIATNGQGAVIFDLSDE